MPSFDIVSEVDLQTLDNAINNLKKEILNRFDFQGSQTEIELNKKEYSLHIITENDMKMRQIEETLISKLVKQGIDPKCLDFGKEKYASGKLIKKDIIIKNGLDKEMAKKIVKKIKDLGLKVQAAIQDDQVRVTGKKIDDLQEVIQALKKADLEVPLQFTNMKS
ncbi:MAG: YajQ family cyclic di-GMP-binding protein [Bacteroidia bacterium]|nr:YajQ family cyclic di-GMP-binding protein [Bacteroidia bacterium]